jgi:hypothetical protein
MSEAAQVSAEKNRPFYPSTHPFLPFPSPKRSSTRPGADASGVTRLQEALFPDNIARIVDRRAQQNEYVRKCQEQAGEPHVPLEQLKRSSRSGAASHGTGTTFLRQTTATARGWPASGSSYADLLRQLGVKGIARQMLGQTPAAAPGSARPAADKAPPPPFFGQGGKAAAAAGAAPGLRMGFGGR